MERESVIPIMRITDLHVAVAWYSTLGFTLEHVHPFEPRLPASATIARNDITLFVSEHAGDARPDTLIYLRVHDVEQLAELLAAEVESAPWGTEFDATDPDGNRLRIGRPSWS